MPTRVPPPTVPANERDSLEAWLEYHRATLLLKCQGLTPEQLATASVPPSELSLHALVRHMIGVEAWFHSFDGEPHIDALDDEDWLKPEPDAATVERDFALYAHACERSRKAVAGLGLDEVMPMPHWNDEIDGKEMLPTSLRWVYQHMIEEYARHNGHADLIRERIDGAVGE